MRSVFRSTTVVVVLLMSAVAARAQNPQACQSVQFSAEVLARFPGAPASCLDVISRDGQQYAVFKAHLESVQGNRIQVRVKNADGTRGERKTIETKPGRKVLIDGKSYPLSELAPNQEITAYVRVDRPVIALAPAAETDPLEEVPIVGPEQESGPVHLSSANTPVMPHTASPLGLIALTGLSCLGIALLMAANRRRNG